MSDIETEEVNMDVREFEEFVPCVIERMRADGCAEGPIGTAEWVLRWFAENAPQCAS